MAEKYDPIYRRDIINRVASETSLTKDQVDEALKGFLDVMLEHMQQDNGRVVLTGFGTFTNKPRKGRSYRHPDSGEMIRSGERRFVSFKAGRLLQKALDPA